MVRPSGPMACAPPLVHAADLIKPRLKAIKKRYGGAGKRLSARAKRRIWMYWAKGNSLRLLTGLVRSTHWRGRYIPGLIGPQLSLRDHMRHQIWQVATDPVANPALMLWGTHTTIYLEPSSNALQDIEQRILFLLYTQSEAVAQMTPMDPGLHLRVSPPRPIQGTAQLHGRILTLALRARETIQILNKAVTVRSLTSTTIWIRAEVREIQNFLNSLEPEGTLRYENGYQLALI